MLVLAKQIRSSTFGWINNKYKGFMNYVEAQNYINKIMELGSRPGIDAIKELLSRLDNPQDKLNVIHVAGTNGKGSICTYLEYGFRELGLRVGRYISPTLFTYLERFQIDGNEMSEAEFADIISEVKIKCDEMVNDGLLQPTTFEVETAVAFIYFVRNKVDVVVLETGMGGKGDATNVVSKPLATIFASISYDHMQFLGNTLSEIAMEKAGIMREGVPVIASHMPDCEIETLNKNALDTLRKEAERINATFYSADDLCDINDGFSYSHEDINIFNDRDNESKPKYEVCVSKRQHDDNCDNNFNVVETADGIKYNGRIINNPLLGKFQLYNLATALTTVSVLWDSIRDIINNNNDEEIDGWNPELLYEKSGIDENNIISDKKKIIDTFVTGVERAKWPGRFEIISKDPLIIRDGAHNPDAIKLLKKSVLKDSSIPNKLHLIMGVFKDKEYDKMLTEILPIAKSFTAITPPNKSRALKASDLCKMAENVYNRNTSIHNSYFCDKKSGNDNTEFIEQSGNSVERIVFSYFDDENSVNALKKAIESVNYEPGDGILVFGSLSLAGLFE